MVTLVVITWVTYGFVTAPVVSMSNFPGMSSCEAARNWLLTEAVSRTTYQTKARCF